ncbi:hypothetical protein [Dictyobacter kobayashii]|uniref:Uncharacterized protein n=1 Tax=Dictyobacter kobayashii TaxID=2014872 RepID=A0A402AMM5_9CHLR|nr:hypothetical protein [Dictyobacter kobayashii]GCE20448.1 hypothetical protein KDK_42480 [Dictyobacter kobayashii]
MRKQAPNQHVDHRLGRQNLGIANLLNDAITLLNYAACTGIADRIANLDSGRYGIGLNSFALSKALRKTLIERIRASRLDRGDTRIWLIKDRL